jgi:hypothetical protein
MLMHEPPGRRGASLLGAALALLAAGCSPVDEADLAPATGDEPGADGVAEDPAYPPIDPTMKYFKPGPPLATPDEAEHARRSGVSPGRDRGARVQLRVATRGDHAPGAG